MHEFRPVLICDHDTPFIVDSRFESCENRKGTREPLNGVYSLDSKALNAGYSYLEYRWGHGEHNAHYIDTEVREVGEWKEFG